MEFGRVQNVEEVDFTLPPDHADTHKMFSSLKKKTVPVVHVGCAKWGRKDWIGQIYPKGTKEKDFLKFYGENFDCIELNATFHQIPKEESLLNWKNSVPAHFKFRPKLNRSITHFKRLKDAGAVTEGFVSLMEQLEEKLGTSFMQLDDRFALKSFENFAQYIRSFPKNYPLAVEFRHPEWFMPSALSDEAFQLMRENGIHTVITDSSGRRDVVHQRLTTPLAFIRFVGNGLHPTDYQRIDDWVQRIKIWLGAGLQELYFYMHQHDERHSPILCRYVIRELNKHCGLNLKEPHLLNDDQTVMF